MSDSEEPSAQREMVVTVEREIAASPAEVWGMVSDLPRMGEWSPENQGAKWVGGATGPAVGAKFRGRNRNGWRRWSTSGVVTECEPGEAFAFDVLVGPLKVARWSYRFEPTATGCKVTEQWDDIRAGYMKTLGHVASGVGDRHVHNRAGMEITLANLAKAAEG
jgi:uncharacterized protein YndB with AHSA1/START domain